MTGWFKFASVTVICAREFRGSPQCSGRSVSVTLYRSYKRRLIMRMNRYGSWMATATLSLLIPLVAHGTTGYDFNSPAANAVLSAMVPFPCNGDAPYYNFDKSAMPLRAKDTSNVVHGTGTANEMGASWMSSANITATAPPPGGFTLGVSHILLYDSAATMNPLADVWVTFQ